MRYFRRLNQVVARRYEKNEKERTMKRTSTMMNTFLLGSSLLTFLLPVDAQVNVVSDTTWTVSDANGNPLGNAQNVCLNATAPSNCPAGATQYGYGGNAWTANLTGIPGATW